LRSSLAGLLDRLRDRGSDLTPDEAAHRSAVTAARRALREAESRHAARVRAARQELRRAEQAHATSVRSAGKELRRAEREAEGALGEAGRRLPGAAAAQELGVYGTFILFQDRLDTGFGIVPLTSSFRAYVAPMTALAQALSETHPPTRIVDARGRPRRRPSPKRTYLVLHGEDVRLLVESRDEEAARSFAELVRVAALNVDRITNARREAEAGREGQLAGVRLEHAARIEDARERLETAEGDRAEIEAATRTLAEVEADTAEIDRLREELAAVERLEEPAA
jgi:hypothetical protein